MIRLILVLLLAITPALGATPPDTTVPFYHGAADRAGNYIVPSLNWQTAGAVHRVQDFDGHVEGHIYAQPLYWRAPGGGLSLVIAATESDLVYGLNADTGHVVWRTALGQPAHRSALPCGNIDPPGITGTPVLDGRGAPIVTTTDGVSNPIVWIVGAEGDDRLHGFRGDTGHEIFTDGADDRMTGLRHFATILTAAGRFYVAGDGRIFAFDLPR